MLRPSVQVQRWAARVYVTLTAAVVAFQLALAAGAPWGGLAMGGFAEGRLPPGLRVAMVVQAAILVVLAGIVASRARLMLPSWHAWSRKLVWVVVGVTALSTVMNAVTPSALERALWLPVNIVLLVCAVLVARGEESA